MDMLSLVLVGTAVFCVGLGLAWKLNRRMTPEERALYDHTFNEARKGAIVEKAIADAQRQSSSSGLAGGLQRIGESFASLQEEGRKLNLPSLVDYDKDNE